MIRIASSINFLNYEAIKYAFVDKMEGKIVKIKFVCYILLYLNFYFCTNFCDAKSIAVPSKEAKVLPYFEGQTIIPIAVEIDLNHQTELVFSLGPNKRRDPVTFYDFLKRYVAYKVHDNKQCFIGDIGRKTSEGDRRRLAQLKSGIVKGFYIPITLTIHREIKNKSEVLEQFGNPISSFCNGSSVFYVTNDAQLSRTRRDTKSSSIWGGNRHFAHHSYGNSQTGAMGRGGVVRDGQSRQHQVRTPGSQSYPSEPRESNVLAPPSNGQLSNRNVPPINVPFQNNLPRKNFGAIGSGQFSLQTAQDSGYQMDSPFGLSIGNSHRGAGTSSAPKIKVSAGLGTGGLIGGAAAEVQVNSAPSQVQIGLPSGAAQGSLSTGINPALTLTGTPRGSDGAESQSSGLGSGQVQVNINGEGGGPRIGFNGKVPVSGGLSLGQSDTQLQGSIDLGKTHVATAQGVPDSTLGFKASGPLTSGSLPTLISPIGSSSPELHPTLKVAVDTGQLQHSGENSAQLIVPGGGGSSDVPPIKDVASHGIGGLIGGTAAEVQVDSAPSQVQIGLPSGAASSSAQGSLPTGINPALSLTGTPRGSAGAESQPSGLGSGQVQVNINGGGGPPRIGFNGKVPVGGGLSLGQSDTQLQGSIDLGKTHAATAQGVPDSTLGLKASGPLTSGSLPTLISPIGSSSPELHPTLKVAVDTGQLQHAGENSAQLIVPGGAGSSDAPPIKDVASHGIGGLIDGTAAEVRVDSAPSQVQIGLPSGAASSSAQGSIPTGVNPALTLTGTPSGSTGAESQPSGLGRGQVQVNINGGGGRPQIGFNGNVPVGGGLSLGQSDTQLQSSIDLGKTHAATAQGVPDSTSGFKASGPLSSGSLPTLISPIGSSSPELHPTLKVAVDTGRLQHSGENSAQLIVPGGAGSSFNPPIIDSLRNTSKQGINLGQVESLQISNGQTSYIPSGQEIPPLTPELHPPQHISSSVQPQLHIAANILTNAQNIPLKHEIRQPDYQLSNIDTPSLAQATLPSVIPGKPQISSIGPGLQLPEHQPSHIQVPIQLPTGLPPRVTEGSIPALQYPEPQTSHILFPSQLPPSFPVQHIPPEVPKSPGFQPGGYELPSKHISALRPDRPQEVPKSPDLPYQQPSAHISPPRTQDIPKLDLSQDVPKSPDVIQLGPYQRPSMHISPPRLSRASISVVIIPPRHQPSNIYTQSRVQPGYYNQPASNIYPPRPDSFQEIPKSPNLGYHPGNYQYPSSYISPTRSQAIPQSQHHGYQPVHYQQPSTYILPPRFDRPQEVPISPDLGFQPGHYQQFSTHILPPRPDRPSTYILVPSEPGNSGQQRRRPREPDQGCCCNGRRSSKRRCCGGSRKSNKAVLYTLVPVSL